MLMIFVAVQLLVLASIAWPAVSRHPVTPSVPIVPPGQAFTCTAIAVWDGDGPIWCAEGPRIRLAGIAARELDGTCRPYHPCPAASGIAARDALVTILGGPRGTMHTGHIRVDPVRLSCRSQGWAKGNRTAASCTIANRDLATSLIATRTVLPWASAWRHD